MLTPMMSIITGHRMCWLSATYTASRLDPSPERFVHGTPKPDPLPEAV